MAILDRLNNKTEYRAPVSKETIKAATVTLQKYKQGKANLEKRIVDNEQWYKLRHWECMRGHKDDLQPVSGWLFNAIANKLADAMDNFPSPNVLPREEADKAEADLLSSILPVILEQTDFEETYEEVWNYKLKSGTGVYGVFWNAQRDNGLGGIEVKKVDLLSLFWEAGITDIQDSQNLFNVELVDNAVLERQYSQLVGKLGTKTLDIAEYIYDDSVDTAEKSCVIDWYYKRVNSMGKPVLHYVKYVNDEILFATENDPNFADRGFYDHGLYPFVFDPLFRVEGTPAGFGYIDVAKSTQEYIDRSNQAILENMVANVKPRYFIKSDGAVNEDEYADMSRDFIHVDGNLGQDSVVPVTAKGLPTIYLNVLSSKIDELKETTGNRDVNTGGSANGVTAASAIAAMQEQGSKLSRLANKAAYRCYRKVCLMCIELIRQFFDLPRCFRIVGNNGAERFVTYSNAGLAPQWQGNDYGLDMGTRIPLFDLEISAQKQNPYSKMSQNELALQFYQLGFFNPQMAQQSLACLDMMDFDRKTTVMQNIMNNMQMFNMMMMQTAPPNEAEGTEASAEDKEALGGEMEKESVYTSKARQRVAESTTPV